MNKDVKLSDSAFFAESSLRIAESNTKFFVRVAESSLNFAESSAQFAESTQIKDLKNDA